MLTNTESELFHLRFKKSLYINEMFPTSHLEGAIKTFHEYISADHTENIDLFNYQNAYQ